MNGRDLTLIYLQLRDPGAAKDVALIQQVFNIYQNEVSAELANKAAALKHFSTNYPALEGDSCRIAFLAGIEYAKSKIILEI